MQNLKLSKGLLRSSSLSSTTSNSDSGPHTQNDGANSPPANPPSSDSPPPQKRARTKSFSLKSPNKLMLTSSIRPTSRHNLPLSTKQISLSNPTANKKTDSSPAICFNPSSDQSNPNATQSQLSVFPASLSTELIELNKTALDVPDPIMAGKEQEIMKQFAQISQSIDSLLQQRKEMQTNHRNWLCDRKKKINQVRRETNLMQNPNQSKSNNLIVLQVLNI